jgi:hypothetical protein
MHPFLPSPSWFVIESLEDPCPQPWLCREEVPGHLAGKQHRGSVVSLPPAGGICNL